MGVGTRGEGIGDPGTGEGGSLGRGGLGDGDGEAEGDGDGVGDGEMLGDGDGRGVGDGDAHGATVGDGRGVGDGDAHGEGVGVGDAVGACEAMLNANEEPNASVTKRSMLHPAATPVPFATPSGTWLAPRGPMPHPGTQPTRALRVPLAQRRSEPSPRARIAAPQGLRYVSLDSPGLRRFRSGRGFRYVTAGGQPLRDASTLARIRRLAVPPAWTDVWICSDPCGHIQAVGRDARGRKQYRYHVRWHAARDEAKYERLSDFAHSLPSLRARTARDLRRPVLDRAKVVAAVVRLLERTLIRVGNEEYARQNRSYGLTTLRNRHASVSGHRVEFRFRGKSGRDHVVAITDRRLGPIVKACQDLPGRALFQYRDERGRRRALTSGDVNAYLREAMSADFSAKDFRTWVATVMAAGLLRKSEAPRSRRHGARHVARTIEAVSSRLGNTPAICRRSYVHPAVIEGYLDRSLPAVSTQPGHVRARLTADERAVLAFLETTRPPARGSASA